MRAKLAYLLLLGAWIAVDAGPAGAHVQYRPFSLNRYKVIAFEDTGLRLRTSSSARSS